MKNNSYCYDYVSTKIKLGQKAMEQRNLSVYSGWGKGAKEELTQIPYSDILAQRRWALNELKQIYLERLQTPHESRILKQVWQDLSLFIRPCCYEPKYETSKVKKHHNNSIEDYKKHIHLQYEACLLEDLVSLSFSALTKCIDGKEAATYAGTELLPKNLFNTLVNLVLKTMMDHFIESITIEEQKVLNKITNRFKASIDFEEVQLHKEMWVSEIKATFDTQSRSYYSHFHSLCKNRINALSENNDKWVGLDSVATATMEDSTEEVSVESCEADVDWERNQNKYNSLFKECLNTLRPEEYNLVFLFYIEGKSIKEIAVELSHSGRFMNEANVKYRKKIALKKLLSEMKKRMGDWELFKININKIDLFFW